MSGWDMRDPDQYRAAMREAGSGRRAVAQYPGYTVTVPPSRPDRRRVAGLAVAPDKFPNDLTRAIRLDQFCREGIQNIRSMDMDWMHPEFQDRMRRRAGIQTHVRTFKAKARAYFERVKPVRSLFG